MDRRKENIKALKDWDELVGLVGEMSDQMREVLVRDRFSPGTKVHRRGELAEMDGTPPPHYSDPTGDAAVWTEEIDDPTHQTITDMARTITNLKSSLDHIRDLNDIDVTKRALRNVPDCLACGDPCLGRVLSGFDEKCYRRWTRSGRPDRVRFIRETKEEKLREAIEIEKSSGHAPATPQLV